VEDAFNIAINSGAKDCSQINGFHEIITKREDFYKIKTNFEKKIDTFAYSAIEWRAIDYLNLNEEQSKKMIEVLNNLEELDDVQNIFSNANLKI
jgi:transcriptional/translational regulatory protein YebC/TACO1